ncbi:MAG: hypothetical protein ABSH47_14725 [Bryobacteraceae bacterium]|jgi:hypothetical protein
MRFAWTLSVVCGVGAVGQANTEYPPLTPGARFQWFVLQTAGPSSLARGLVSAGWGTLFDHPREYGTHWDGFGQRYGMRLTGVAARNAMEAGIGALWGEDPRYRPATGEPFRARLAQVVRFTYLDIGRDGRAHPAYARYAAISGSNFLSNAWRPDSEANAASATRRIGISFLSGLAGNAWKEFWPDVRRRLARRHPAP